MKLVRMGQLGFEKPGVVLENGKIINVSAFVKEYDEYFFANNGVADLMEWLKTNAAVCSEFEASERIGSPIARPSKLVCVGLNYAKHAKEFKKPIPKEPVLFFKATTAICGPNDVIVLPEGAVKTDWEVELAIVIGKEAKNIDETSVFEHIAGYVMMNDVSERGFQLEREGQWCKGKSADTFAPLGPYLVTKDEIENPNNLELWLKVNGEMKQQSTTADFIFNVQQVVSYISQFMTLLPGDVISTGTPSGIALGFTPPQFLKSGDVIEMGVEGLGVAKQVVK